MRNTSKNPTPSDETSPKVACSTRENKGGAPRGNNNSVRHGLKGGALPRDCKYLENRLNRFRRTIEAEVLRVKGTVSLLDAALIQSCIRWERHACLAHRWLVKQMDELKPEQKVMFSREICRASSERDKSLSALEISEETHNIWSIIDVPQIESPEESGSDQADR